MPRVKEYWKNVIANFRFPFFISSKMIARKIPPPPQQKVPENGDTSLGIPQWGYLNGDTSMGNIKFDVNYGGGEGPAKVDGC